MRHLIARCHFPRLDLDPVPVLLVDDLLAEVQKCTDPCVFHCQTISSADIFTRQRSDSEPGPATDDARAACRASRYRPAACRSAGSKPEPRPTDRGRAFNRRAEVRTHPRRSAASLRCPASLAYLPRLPGLGVRAVQRGIQSRCRNPPRSPPLPIQPPFQTDPGGADRSARRGATAPSRRTPDPSPSRRRRYANPRRSG